MFERVKSWWHSPSLFDVNQSFASTLAKSVAMREALDAEERAEERGGQSLPPPERESGPDVLDGVSLGAHP